METKKFVVDLSKVDLSEEQISKIQAEIGKAVSQVLLENATTKKIELEPLRRPGGGPGGGGTMGYKPRLA